MSAEFEIAEEDLNEFLGRMGQVIRDTAGATNALSCGTTDRESNEVRNQQEVLNVMEDIQRRDARREVAETISLERQR